MRVAISAPDAFVAPYLREALGDACVEIPPEALEEGNEMLLDALLVPCTTLVHFNASSSSGAGRDDRESLLAMRDAAKPILGAVNRHQGLHLILVGTLRVHPQATPDDPFYSGETRLAPRDVAAEGQLWVEESALEHAEAERPVTIVRASNVQGLIQETGEGHGLLHDFARDAIFGWVSVPGDGSQSKDFIHVRDLVEVIMGVIHNPPPTRDAIAAGTGRAVPLKSVAEQYEAMTGAAPQYGNDDSSEVWGVVDVLSIEERIGFRPQITLEQMIEEAMQNVG